MIKVSDAILAIIRGNPFLEFGVHHQLFNSAQLARYLQPFIAARTHTDTKESAIAIAIAIAMALSRFLGWLRVWSKTLLSYRLSIPKCQCYRRTVHSKFYANHERAPGC